MLKQDDELGAALVNFVPTLFGAVNLRQSIHFFP